MRIRTTILLMLIIYFAGFASGIYTLGPAGEQSSSSERTGFMDSLRSEQLAENLNDGLHRCIEFARKSASRIVDYINSEKDSQDDRA